MDPYYKGRSPLPERFLHALRGLKHAWQREPNFKIEVTIGAGVIGVITILPLTSTQRAILVLTVAFVLVLEMINSVFERMIDIMHPKFSEEVKKIKDTMAGAVFLGSLASVMVAGFIFIQPLGIFDSAFRNTVSFLQTDTSTEIAKTVTLAGNWQIVVALAIFASAGLLWRKRYEMASFLLGSVLFGGILVLLLKFLSGRLRPPGSDMIDNFSFPSGHAFMVTALWLALTYVLTDKNTKRKYLWAMAGTVIFLVAASRIILDVHWVSDAVAGVMFATVWVLLWYGINKKIFQKNTHE
ncbi:MAG: diacylglycerol kinase [Candidatus Spechtbacteria bacterium]|nr:diacylglycerol kinase [Candidatus Spechtbacteria bacterium]